MGAKTHRRREHDSKLEIETGRGQMPELLARRRLLECGVKGGSV